MLLRSVSRSSALNLLLLLVFAISHLVSATALTFSLSPNEKSCFFAHVPSKNNKVAFYFAVQSGGSFDVDFVVSGPNDRVIFDGEKERQGDFVFAAREPGEYSFCFDNEMSTVTDKMVDFEITVENESPRAALPSKQGAPAEQTSLLSESIYKISGQLSTMSRNQKYFRTRENRNFSTVRSTEKRIWRFSIVENLTMVSMAALQVFVVRFFFTGARKGYV